MQNRPLELRRVRLPEGEDLYRVLEVAVEEAGTVVSGEDFAGVDACHDELEAASILGEAEASLGDGSDLPGEMSGVRLEGRERC